MASSRARATRLFVVVYANAESPIRAPLSNVVLPSGSPENCSRAREPHK
jgi:hypothetical protein